MEDQKNPPLLPGIEHASAVYELIAYANKPSELSRPKYAMSLYSALCEMSGTYEDSALLGFDAMEDQKNPSLLQGIEHVSAVYALIAYVTKPSELFRPKYAMSLYSALCEMSGTYEDSVLLEFDAMSTGQ